MFAVCFLHFITQISSIQAKDNIHPKYGFDGSATVLVLQIVRGTLGADDFVDFCEGRFLLLPAVWPHWKLDHGFGGCSTIFMGMEHLSMSIIEDDYYHCRGSTIRNIPSFIMADRFPICTRPLLLCSFQIPCVFSATQAALSSQSHNDINIQVCFLVFFPHGCSTWHPPVLFYKDTREVAEFVHFCEQCWGSPNFCSNIHKSFSLLKVLQVSMNLWVLTTFPLATTWRIFPWASLWHCWTINFGNPLRGRAVFEVSSTEATLNYTPWKLTW